jgi:hypothetical protein
MKRIVLSLFIVLSAFGVFAQDKEGSNNQHMAFYGVDYDTLHHKRDTISHVDSAHFAITASAAAAFNKNMQGLIILENKQSSLNNSGLAGLMVQYSGMKCTTGSAFSFGFDYVSKEYGNHWFFSAGVEAIKFNCSGSVYQTNRYSPLITDTLYYTIAVLSLDLPLKIYYRFVKTPKFRFSAGAGVSIGTFIGQLSNSTYVGQFNLNSFTNLAYAGLRFDFAMGRHTWLALEPFYNIQMIDAITHIELAGVKLELL